MLTATNVINAEDLLTAYPRSGDGGGCREPDTAAVVTRPITIPLVDRVFEYLVGVDDAGESSLVVRLWGSLNDGVFVIVCP